MEEKDKKYVFKDKGKDFVAFTIKSQFTEDSLAVHNAFRSFCKEETNDDYTQGLKRLIEGYSSDWKYESLYLEIQRLKEKVEELKEPDQKKEEGSKLSTLGKKGEEDE